jgi:hemerythrin superfamily protein
MNPVKLIKQDHRTVKALFRKFEKASRRADRQKLGVEIIEELTVHTAIEEQLIYPALRARDKRLAGSVLNAFEEHHAVKMVLAELDRMKIDDERYAAKMHVVQEAVEKHIEEEESKLLPRLERLLGAEDSERMARAIMIMKKAAPRHPLPFALDTRRAAVAALFARLNDTGKDLMRKLVDGHKAEANGNGRATRRAKPSTAAIAAKRARQQAGPRRGATAH